jgi:hypothetical protein
MTGEPLRIGLALAGELCPVGAPRVADTPADVRNQRPRASKQSPGAPEPLTDGPKWSNLPLEGRSYGKCRMTWSR